MDRVGRGTGDGGRGTGDGGRGTGEEAMERVSPGFFAPRACAPALTEAGGSGADVARDAAAAGGATRAQSIGVAGSARAR